MQVAIAALLLITVGVGSLIGWDLWQQNAHPAVSTKAITPPAGPALRGPLSAGTRFVFLRDGVLWSTPADGSSQAEQLTTKDITVAANWVVSPPLPGRDAGDMVAYIDLQQALVHTIRSDGQSDTVIHQPLLKAGIAPSSVWDTSVGEVILDSLAWSSDGSMLAFVADPTGAGATDLYILSTVTGSVQVVPLPFKGSVSHPVWSPDGIRVTFELTHNGVVSILDYNTQNHGVLVITDNVNAGGKLNDTVLALDWSPAADTPTITWSVGQLGHVHSIWSRRVGNGGNAFPQEIAQGDYVQAIYSRAGDGGMGSWLLVASYLGRAANLWRLDVTPGAVPVELTNGKQVNYAQWSPDGTQVDYLDSISSGVGTLHVVTVTSLVDMFIASGVTNEPAPAWSVNGKELVYSTSRQTVVADIQQGSFRLHSLKLRGLASTFMWSPSSPQQLIVALSDGQPGAYLVDTQHNTTLQVDQRAITSPILWTEIP
jgi:Tol biopolymer transport system component